MESGRNGRSPALVVIAIVSALVVLVGAAVLLTGRGVESPIPLPGTPTASPTTSPTPTGAPLPLRYGALGDSFAAGQGGGGSTGVCYRSDAGYPAQLDGSRAGTDAGEGSAEPAIDLVVDASCSGATTVDVRAEQVPRLPDDTGLVTITVGGNDLNAVGVAVLCAEAPASPECDASLAAVRELLNSGELTERLSATFADIAIATPDAALVVTGYPLLFEAPAPDDPSFDAVAALNETTVALNDAIRAAVAPAVASGRAVCFVDVIGAFTGHGIGSAQPFVLADGPDAFHPNAAGNRAYAEVIRTSLPCAAAGQRRSGGPLGGPPLTEETGVD